MIIVTVGQCGYGSDECIECGTLKEAKAIVREIIAHRRITAVCECLNRLRIDHIRHAGKWGVTTHIFKTEYGEFYVTLFWE